MRLNYRTQVGVAKLCLLGIVLLCFTFGLVFFGCEESPFKPVEPEIKDYRAWFWDGFDHYKLYSYHTANGEVTTATIEWSISENPTISHDGSLIYIPSGEVVKVLETDSFTTVGEIPHYSKEQVVVSPDGQYVAVFGDSSWIVKTSDYSTIYTDSGRGFSGCFSANSKNLYTATGDVCRISLADPEQIIREQLTEGYFIRQVAPTPDETKLLVYIMIGTFVNSFGVYDIALDSLLSYDVQSPGNGVFAMTPDGKRAYYGNPGTIFHGGPPPTSEMTLYDIESRRVVKRWDMEGLFEELEPYQFPIGETVISPDGRWLLTHIGIINHSTAVIQWDIQNERLENYYIDLGIGARGLSIQLVE